MDSSPYVDARGGAPARVAWLLGTSRLSTQRGAFANRRTFVPALAAAGVSCDESRVSRWESGASACAPAVLTGYERVLGLPRHSLRAVAVAVSDQLAAPVARDRVPDDEFEQLMEVVLDEEPSGEQWFTFAEEVTHRPNVYMRGELWRSLCSQLVQEMSRSLRVGYLTRRAALRRLLEHPVAGPLAAAAVQEYVDQPGSTRVADAVSLLQHLPGQEATGAVVRLLHHGREAVRRGALRASAWLLNHRLYAARHLDLLEEVVTSGLKADDEAFHLADLVHRLPAEVADRVRTALPDHPAIAVVAERGEVVAPDVATAATARVIATVLDRAPEPLGGPDEMLERLVREALFHAHPERRHQAAWLLMMSPYRALLGSACAGLVDGAEPIVATRAVGLMRFCAAATTLPLLLGVSAHGTDVQRPAALVALGNNPHALTSAQGRLLIDASGARPATRDVEALRYALAMHGRAELLTSAAPPTWTETAAARLTS